MEKLKNWTAKRAGGRITIVGSDVETGTSVKIVGVDQIAAGKNGKPPVAVDRNGERYELV